MLNTVLSSSARNLRSGDVLTVQVLYRSVESGTHGAIQEFTSGTFYDDNRVQDSDIVTEINLLSTVLSKALRIQCLPNSKLSKKQFNALVRDVQKDMMNHLQVTVLGLEVERT
eukprot:COSAG02_NODE_4292_length_5541_cov_1.733370_3_plen_113_part_00